MQFWKFKNRSKTVDLSNKDAQEELNKDNLTDSIIDNSNLDLISTESLRDENGDGDESSLDQAPGVELSSIQIEDALEDAGSISTETLVEESKNEEGASYYPEYPIGKELRQGPWFHPFPLIVGLSIFALVVSLVAANLQINRLQDELDKTDYFHYPPNLSQLITKVQKSTMVVKCGDSLGSGWVIALAEVIDSASEETKRLDKAYPGSVVTNYHVIANCVNAPRAVTTSNGGDYYESILFSYDKENDLALVSTKLVLPPLEISKKPSPGWWSMALGSPYGIEKSISIGNIMNVIDKEIISTAPINPGNSGGPLVNSFGEVIGTNTWKLLGGASGINVARSVSLLCAKLVVCNNGIW